MTTRVLVAVVLFGAAGLMPAIAAAADYVLPFRPTPNMPGAQGEMRIHVANGKSSVNLKIRNAAPDTVYTIWTVFGHLVVNENPVTREITMPASVPQCAPTGGGSQVTCPGWQGWEDAAGVRYPRNGGSVSPTARISANFTDGMGADPGATFVTNSKGDGQVTVTLDFDIVNEAPVSNKDVMVQCVPDADVVVDASGGKSCANGAKTMRVTSTWLRVFIKEIPRVDRAATCANYDPILDPETPGLTAAELARAVKFDTRLWQCVDPETNMPRVRRWGFDHFRIANHVDGLTHGFIGGNKEDHIIDLVGRREDLVPPAAPLIPYVP